MIVTGVVGAGKRTVGEALARRLGWDFLDGDTLHPPGNLRKLAAGEVLSDADRWPWLERLRELARTYGRGGGSLVLACAVLERAYRQRLAGPGVRFVHLVADRELVEARLATRPGRLVPAAFVEAQFAALEPPTAGEATLVDAALPVPEAVRRIVAALAEAEDPTGGGRG